MGIIGTAPLLKGLIRVLALSSLIISFDSKPVCAEFRSPAPRSQHIKRNGAAVLGSEEGRGGPSWLVVEFSKSRENMAADVVDRKGSALRLRGGGQDTVRVKTLTGETFSVPYEDSEKVLQLKERIAQLRGYDASEQALKDPNGLKLIHAGQTFLVLMPPKGVRNTQVTQRVLQRSSGASNIAASSASGASDQANTAAPVPTIPASPTQAPVGDVAAGEDWAAVTAEQIEEHIRQLVAMGISEAEARRAMRQARNHPAAAVEILFGGAQFPAAASAGHATPSATPSASGAVTSVPAGQAAAAPAAGAGPLDFLRTVPQFTLMRQSIQMQPQLLPQLLQQLGRTNPQLLSLINAHQSEFVRLINEPVSQEELQTSLQEAQQAEAQQRQQNTLQVTAEEMQQIERLEALVVPMGLDRQAVLEAWLACDKNEELAANYLLNNLEDILASRQ